MFLLVILLPSAKLDQIFFFAFSFATVAFQLFTQCIDFSLYSIEMKIEREKTLLIPKKYAWKICATIIIMIIIMISKEEKFWNSCTWKQIRKEICILFLVVVVECIWISNFVCIFLDLYKCEYEKCIIEKKKSIFFDRVHV